MTTIAEAAITLTIKMLEGKLLERFKEAAPGTGPQLTAAEREELGRVMHIGGSFLDGCSGLTALDLTPLSKLTLKLLIPQTPGD